MTKKKKVLKKKPILFLIIILVLISAGLVYYYINYNGSKTPKEVIVKVESEIKDFNYYLNDNDTSLYKKEFAKLTKILGVEDVDYESYSESISKLFVLDFYDLNSKTTNSDIGGTQFIYSKNLDNFILNAKDTIYKNVESNIYKDRKQDLPSIASLSILENNKSTFKIGKVLHDSYEVKVGIEYKEDLKYPEVVLITLVKNDKKLEIVKIEKSVDKAKNQ